MGYSHHWRRPLEIAADRYALISEDVSRLFHYLEKENLVILGNEVGESRPIVETEEIVFNGSKGRGESYETFYFPRVAHPPRVDDQGKVFEFTKTNKKPYDQVVCAVLIVMKRHLGDEILISSDGDDHDWTDARDLCEIALKYGSDFVIDPGGDLQLKERL